MHDACATSELFGSVKCDCAQQLRRGLRLARAEAGTASIPGAVVYLPQEGRGIGLAAKAAAYALQAAGADTVDANRLLGLPDDSRCYDGARDALWDAALVLQQPLPPAAAAGAAGVPVVEPGIRLLSNNPRKRRELERLGVRVAESLPHLAEDASALAMGYLRAKTERMGHTIPAQWLQH
jgi:GTP cyclohydrolase II